MYPNQPAYPYGTKESNSSNPPAYSPFPTPAPYPQLNPTAYPPQQQQAYPPQSQGYPPGQQVYPPQPQGYPPEQQVYPPQPQGYPPQPQGYPPQPQGYPPHPQNYPPYTPPTAAPILPPQNYGAPQHYESYPSSTYPQPQMHSQPPPTPSRGEPYATKKQDEEETSQRGIGSKVLKGVGVAGAAAALYKIGKHMGKRKEQRHFFRDMMTGGPPSGGSEIAPYYAEGPGDWEEDAYDDGYF